MKTRARKKKGSVVDSYAYFSSHYSKKLQTFAPTLSIMNKSGGNVFKQFAQTAAILNDAHMSF